jgi:hypothetical protein
LILQFSTIIARSSNSILGALGITTSSFAAWLACTSFYIFSIMAGSLAPTVAAFAAVTYYVLLIVVSVDNPKLSISEHKQNELINASISTHIETSSSTDMDYDVTKISPLQLDKRGRIVLPPSPPPPTMTSKPTIDDPSSPSENSNQVQNDNHSHFEFGLPVQEVLRLLVPGIPGIITKEDNEKQIWFSVILDKSTHQVISATVGRIYHKTT